MAHHTFFDTHSLNVELTELASNADALTAEERDRLNALVELRDEIGGEWEYGETLIPENDFQEYAQELADDLGLLNDPVAWPYTCIDWERAANDLASDYSLIKFDNEWYYVKC